MTPAHQRWPHGPTHAQVKRRMLHLARYGVPSGAVKVFKLRLPKINGGCIGC